MVGHAGCAALLAICACSSEVPLGSWQSGLGGGAAGVGGVGGVGGSTGGAANAGNTGATNCQRSGTPGALNAPGTDLGATLTATDWSFEGSSDSIEVELVIESRPAHDGYFWASQFSFVGSAIGGFVGLQARGGYQAEPPDGDTDIADMAVFWIGGSPLRAELGDIAAPDARPYAQLSSGTQWWTIHARYDLVTCRPYRLRVARQAQEANGDAWYGAWVRDNQSNVETFIGRIQVPAAWGLLADKSTTFSDRVGWGTVSSCSYPEYVSARFGIPSAASGSLAPTAHSNRFGSPAKCSSSRFTELSDGVRQELGVP